MTTTQNLHLPQWEADDRIMRTDFNEAFAKIDEGMSGGLKVETGSYIGNGLYGAEHPNTLNFDFAPKLVLIKLKDNDIFPSIIIGGDIYAKSITRTLGGGVLRVSTSGNSISWYHTGNTWSANSSSGGSPIAGYQLNALNAVYFYAVFG